MEYSEDVASKNPPPNGITAAEIEALSAKVRLIWCTATNFYPLNFLHSW